MSEYTFNPLAGIQPEEWAQHAGNLVAVARDGSGILGSAATSDELWDIINGGTITAEDVLVQSCPDLSRLTAQTYQELCDTLS